MFLLWPFIDKFTQSLTKSVSIRDNLMICSYLFHFSVTAGLVHTSTKLSCGKRNGMKVLKCHGCFFFLFFQESACAQKANVQTNSWCVRTWWVQTFCSCVPHFSSCYTARKQSVKLLLHHATARHVATVCFSVCILLEMTQTVEHMCECIDRF